jgi:hypothetical protein
MKDNCEPASDILNMNLIQEGYPDLAMGNQNGISKISHGADKNKEIMQNV